MGCYLFLHEEGSVVRKEVSSQRNFSFTIKDHLQLGKELDLFDFDAALEFSVLRCSLSRRCLSLYYVGITISYSE